MSRHRDKYRSKVKGLKNRGHRRANGTLKRPYPEAEAKRVAERMRSQRRSSSATAYPCTVCDFWHVGSSRKASPGDRAGQRTIVAAVVVKPSPDGGFLAVDPSRPGCRSYGKTEREAAERIAAAIVAWDNASPAPCDDEGATR